MVLDSAVHNHALRSRYLQLIILPVLLLVAILRCRSFHSALYEIRISSHSNEKNLKSLKNAEKKYKSAQSAKVSLTKHLRLNVVWKHLSAKVHPSLLKVYHTDHHREISVSCKVLNAFRA